MVREAESVAAWPAGIEVIVRDWLNANHVVLSGPAGNVLVDAGHVSGVSVTLERVSGTLGSRPLHRLVLTHCHSDHMGGCAAVRRHFGCSVAIPAGEADSVRAWDGRALWLDYAGQTAERFDFDTVLEPGDPLEMGSHEWEILAAPGHDMAALAFWCPAERILISGDALWHRSFGVVLPGDGWKDRLAAARDTLLAFRALRPSVVIPGHGVPFGDPDEAVEACLSRIAAFEQDERRVARNVIRVMFVYTLLERGTMTVEEVLRMFREVPLFAEYDSAYFGLGAGAHAQTVVDDLARAGTIARTPDGGMRVA
ncbi:MAG: MBL fold metallo-hydrolase [Betaproteobacteria bacterium]|jgi:glyoxylase-like metal-dependent hydrolase (beta-lactamase superfamily II)